jgi:ribosome-binding protein aMBF1 (putative translation factor)
MTNISDIGPIVQKEREGRGWTRNHLAVALGCSTTTLRDIEIGNRLPSSRWIRRLNTVLGTHFEEPKKIPKMTLAQACAEARKMGMTYGKYMVWLQQQNR